jgi:acyl carrier protein
VDDDDGASAADSELLDALRRAPRKRRRSELEAFITSKAALVLRAEPASIDRRVALRELGLDSLTALELANHLGRALGLRLGSTLLFTYPSVAAVAEHLGDQLRVFEDAAHAEATAGEARTSEPTAPPVSGTMPIDSTTISPSATPTVSPAAPNTATLDASARGENRSTEVASAADGPRDLDALTDDEADALLEQKLRELEARLG